MNGPWPAGTECVVTFNPSPRRGYEIGAMVICGESAKDLVAVERQAVIELLRRHGLRPPIIGQIAQNRHDGEWWYHPIEWMRPRPPGELDADMFEGRILEMSE